MFENFTRGDSGHYLLRRTSWEPDNQNSVSYDEGVEHSQPYPPTYSDSQYHEHRFLPSKGTTDLVGPGYYPPTSYSPSPHTQTEEAQPISQPVHVVAPTPVNLIIQTNFTRVEHSYHYASQESDTSGYGSTPPPTTASSTRSSFSFGSADSPTTPFDQIQEHPGNHNSQSHPTARNVYLPYSFRHQYDVVDSRYYQQSPLPEHGTSPCHAYPDGGLHPHETCYPPAGDYGSPDQNCEYESEPESDRGWITYQTSGYEVYAAQNQAAGAWRHPSWFHPALTRSDDGVHGNKISRLESTEYPAAYNAHYC